MCSDVCEFDLIDPCPDVHALFVLYDELYFEGKLGACSVEWSSKRMTLCAGVCSYSHGGGCIIKLSQPLLKLRPVIDLKETLLHEMIHAYHFLLKIRDNDNSGHGDKFKEKMNFINRANFDDPQRPPGGYNVTVYHSFHAEVDLFRQHWWKCETCSRIVKRSMNRPPQNADCPYRKPENDSLCTCAHHAHVKNCGGQFKKIKEPENFKKKGDKSDEEKKKQRPISDFLPVVKDQEKHADSADPSEASNLEEKRDKVFFGKPNFLGQEPKAYFPGGPTTLQTTASNTSLAANNIVMRDNRIRDSSRKDGPEYHGPPGVAVAYPMHKKRKADDVEQVDLVAYDEHKISIQNFVSWKNQHGQKQFTKTQSALTSHRLVEHLGKDQGKDIEIVDLTDDV